MDKRWQPGDRIVRRELCLGRPWLGQAAIVVADTDDLLALYIAGDSELAYPDGDGLAAGIRGTARIVGGATASSSSSGPTRRTRSGSSGKGRTIAPLLVRQPQTPFLRTAAGIDTEDHELDIVIEPDGAWRLGTRNGSMKGSARALDGGRGRRDPGGGSAASPADLAPVGAGG